jgi:hypothetical protein
VLGARPLGSLAAEAASTAVSTFTVPATTPVPAADRVIAVADAQQQVELDEADNRIVSAPATVLAGRPLAISHAGRNTGPADAFAVGLDLSGDDALEADARPSPARGGAGRRPCARRRRRPRATERDRRDHRHDGVGAHDRHPLTSPRARGPGHRALVVAFRRSVR